MALLMRARLGSLLLAPCAAGRASLLLASLAAAPVLLLLALQAGAQGSEPAPQPYAAYEPARLEAAARERIRAGDLRAAGILLARAQRIAPDDPRVKRGLAVLAAAEAGQALPEEASPVAATTLAPKAAPIALPPEPPPPWPRK